MAKKASKQSTKKKTASRKTKKTSAKRSANKTAQPVVPPYAPKDEHIVLSHLMWILFLFAAGLAAVFTVQFLMERASQPEYYGVAALVFLGWAFVFKVFAHRIHPPHN